MKLAIDMPDEMYRNAKKDMLCGSEVIVNAIKNGTPLEQEPCEDCISRQAAVNALDDEITITGATNAIVVKDYIQRVKRKLDQLPSVNPQEPKAGHWVHDGYHWVNGCWVNRWLCSECGYKLNGERIRRCLYCGVRMEAAHEG